MFESIVRCISRRYSGLYILLHAGIPVAQSREKENVLGAVRAKVQVAVRSRRIGGTVNRLLRMLQRLRRRKSMVGTNSGKFVHSEPRFSTSEVKDHLFSQV